MPPSTRSTNREETPENQTTAPGSFPTPITTQRPRNQAPEREMADQDEATAWRQPTATANDDLSPDLASYLRNQGDTSALSRVLTEFRARVKYLQKPHLLKSASDYPIWKEEILLAMKQSHTEDILTTKPLENASKDMKRFWEERNSWLYNFGGSSRSFIKRLLAIRVEYVRLGYDVPNFIFFDKLLNGLTKGWSSFVKDRMDQAARDNATPLEDDFLGLCKDILLRLPLNDTINNTTSYVTENTKNAKNSKNDDKNTKKKKCTHCKKDGHEEPYCWFVHPKKRPTDWKDKSLKDEDSTPGYTINEVF
ncbi:hypothetical protein ACJ73_09731 [Blastomyces percursus]|uniref:Retrotransposon gag domain-containing protein n=1 Tax=Blastomyces percursus TaxID=1658174 RepID=A0A1J9Q683_9EURO|nr:hypothetical protein ACJ73_09731 [Blastomyces percursus]